MLCKLSVKNLHRSIKDYAIYFFTLVIGVSIFYIFNAIDDQTATLTIQSIDLEVLDLLSGALSAVSVFVAVVLALLIIYASRFLMKRRNKEFALYMLLGMGKGKISAILLIETFFIGLGSLAVGLVIGIGLSQLMSALVASLFAADMTEYRFSFSSASMVRTVIYFSIMYIVVMLFNGAFVTKMKLIDLIQSEKRSEEIKVKNPLLSCIIFLVAALGLAWAYRKVTGSFNGLNQRTIILCIVIGAVCTFLVFLSLSGLLLRIVMSFKKAYFRGLNSFTFRQISSKVNTMIFSMTVICLMLFVTVCTLSSAFSVRNTINQTVNTLCPVDVQIGINEYEGDFKPTYVDIEKIYAEYGYDITEKFKDHVFVDVYLDPSFNFGEFFGPYQQEVRKQFQFLRFDSPEQIMILSDYNALMELFGRATYTLEDDEFMLVANYINMIPLRNMVLSGGCTENIFGHELKSKYDHCIDGFLDLNLNATCSGIFVIPDSVADKDSRVSNYLFGNYDAATKAQTKAMDSEMSDIHQKVYECYYRDLYTERKGQNMPTFYEGFTSRIELYSNGMGISAIITFLGLYIGIVFLIASGAILALKSLTECVDSVQRYDMLRKLGADEGELNRSLFLQTGLFFLFPLAVAAVHSVFGMKFAISLLETAGTTNTLQSLILTCIILLAIYGGYFIITYFSSKNIIKNRI
ncbi:MAG: ABC transporter permease [Lachnospiraceae bacterium]|nr:ABC transporter permease [Lachnospiraceae bacterium]